MWRLKKNVKETLHRNIFHPIVFTENLLIKAGLSKKKCIWITNGFLSINLFRTYLLNLILIVQLHKGSEGRAFP